MQEKSRRIGVKEARQRLVTAGLHLRSFRFPLILGKNPIPETRLRFYEQAIHIFGVENFEALVDQFSRLKCPKKWRMTASSKRIARIAGKVFPLFGSILSHPKVNAAGIKIEIYPSSASQKPFNFSFNVNIGQDRIGAFNFTVYINRHEEPAVILGNMQGASRNAISLFTERTGKPFLNFFHTLFLEALPARNQVFALNPKHHEYTRPRLEHVASAMHAKGMLTERQKRAFLMHSVLQHSFTRAEVQQVNDLVLSEAAKIKTRGIGMHKAALKKAGFRRSLGTFWRRKDLK